MTGFQKELKVISPIFEYKIDVFDISCFTAFISL